MRIQIDNIVRDMTPEEIAEMEEWCRAMLPPDEEREAKNEALTRYSNELTGANDTTLIEAAETLITERIKEES